MDTWTTVFSEDNDCGFYCQHADAHYYTIGITNRLLNPTTIMAYVVQLHNGIYRFALNFLFICFVHPIFRFWFLVTFGNEVTKIQKYCVIFVYILQGKIGKMEKNRKKIMQPK